MNKKIIFYFLAALVVLTFKTDSSYSIPTNSKYDENYWTSEKMKLAKPLTTKNIGFRTRRGVETIKNTAVSSKVLNSMNTMQPFANVNQVNNIPIGMLFMSKDGEDYTCTASVINTDSGNIGVTAAHCLYDPNTESYFDNVMFSPGYDNGQLGPFGKIPIAKMEVTVEFLNDNDDEYDYGMMLFNFNMNGHPLKYFTGALGWQILPGDNIPTTISGYSNGGNIANCPKNGQTLCTWQGVLTVADDFYVVDKVNLGEGASGGPCIKYYDPNTNLGYLFSNFASYDELKEQLLAPTYDILEFHGIIAELEANF